MGFMKVERDVHENGNCYGFIVSNTFCSRAGVYLAVRNIPGCRVTRKPKRIFSWFRESDFCEFVVNGKKFTADEPFGDNSVYGIYCDKPNTIEMEKVIKVFEAKKFEIISILFWLLLITAIVGGVLSWFI